MKFKKGEIKGVVVNILQKYSDDRGVLVETFRIDNLPDKLRPVMSYVSYTKPGIGRGPHEHKLQTDIFTFLGPGEFILKLWDNRKETETYGHYMEITAGESHPVIVIVPPGVVHGYKNISQDKDGMVLNFPDKLYRGWGKKEKVDEIRHEDDFDSPFIL